MVVLHSLLLPALYLLGFLSWRALACSTARILVSDDFVLTEKKRATCVAVITVLLAIGSYLPHFYHITFLSSIIQPFKLVQVANIFVVAHSNGDEIVFSFSCFESEKEIKHTALKPPRYQQLLTAFVSCSFYKVTLCSIGQTQVGIKLFNFWLLLVWYFWDYSRRFSRYKRVFWKNF